MTIDEMNQEYEELIAQGYQRYMNPIDWEVATINPCEICGGKTTGKGCKHLGRYGEYRCWVICENCNEAWEF